VINFRKYSGPGVLGNIIVGLPGGIIGYWGAGKSGIINGKGYIRYIRTAAI